MMLEYGVQSEDTNIGRAEGLGHARCLWQAVRHTARAKHLKGFDQHNTAAQAIQRYGALGI